jgi:hypothetical protein
MKREITSLLALTCVLLTGIDTASARPQRSSQKAQAEAERPYNPEEAIEEALETLFDQGDKLSNQSSKQCPKEHGALARSKSLDIRYFYGYSNANEENNPIVTDSVEARAMAIALQHPCVGNLASCGFTVKSETEHSVRLQKTHEGRKISVSIDWTSVSTDNIANTDPSRLAAKQEARSEEIKRRFARALQTADVVFYVGHSRGGAGPGFDTPAKLADAFNWLTRSPLRIMTDSLRENPKRLKALGLLACESDKYFRRSVEEVSPHLTLFTTEDNIVNIPGEQVSLGILNSIMTKKCNREFLEAVTPEFREEISPGKFKKKKPEVRIIRRAV